MRAEALSDRFCIANGGQASPVLSPEMLVDCDNNDDGCMVGVLELWANGSDLLA